MIFFSFVLFYTFSASIIFVYGIGIERLYIHSKNINSIYHFLIKNILVLIISVSLLLLLDRYILSQLRLRFLLPMFIVSVVMPIDNLLQLLLSKFSFTEIECNEKNFVLGLAFFILYQVSSFTEAMAVVFAASISLLFFSVILNSITYKINDGNAASDWKEAPLILICMGFLLLSFYISDIIWFL